MQTAEFVSALNNRDKRVAKIKGMIFLQNRNHLVHSDIFIERKILDHLFISILNFQDSESIVNFLSIYAQGSISGVFKETYEPKVDT